MSEQILDFCASAGWSNATWRALTSDLSPRKYHRLEKASGDTAILMDATYDATITKSFARVGAWLRRIGLSAPEVYASDTRVGVMLLEDFGDVRMTKALMRAPEQRDDLYETALDIIRTMQANTPSEGTPERGTAGLLQWLQLTQEWYPGSGFDGLLAGLETVFANLAPSEHKISLRDFHADNLMVLPGRKGPKSLGILDFQDAFKTHPLFDLVSLLTDARTQVPPELRQRLAHGFAPGNDAEFAALATLRNLRVLGVFARAVRRDGRTEYLQYMPRVHEYLTEALEHRSLEHLRQLAHTAVPYPDPRLFEAK